MCSVIQLPQISKEGRSSPFVRVQERKLIILIRYRIANTAYLGSNWRIFSGAMRGCHVSGLTVGGISYCGSAIMILSGKTNCSFKIISTNTK